MKKREYMAASDSIRESILKRIQSLPTEKLGQIAHFLESLESTSKKKEIIMSFAGVWSDMDNTTFQELANELKSRRGIII